MAQVDPMTCQLERALEEYATAVGKLVGELTLAERNQAFREYRVSGRHTKGAEEEGHEAE